MQIGKNITGRDDLLTAIEPQQLFEKIKSPDEAALALITRLRAVRSIDAKSYAMLKKQLPYIVCGVFNPPYRKIDNFGYCEYFMADIDHIADKELTVEALKAKIAQDSRVVMCFVSPSEDGLKVMFRLAEKCYDAGKYSLFYKLFLTAFSAQYGLEQVIDSRTSDVSRACFLSHDPNAYFNPKAETVRIEDFVDFDNPFEIKEIQKELTAVGILRAMPSKTDEEQPREPDADALAFIKEKLNAKKAVLKQKPQVYVPEQLDEILGSLVDYIQEAGVTVDSVENIQYGKKFSMHAGLSKAEINLFFGKKGFSVVKSPKQGTSEQLNALMAEYIQAFISEYILLRENIAVSYKPTEIKTKVPEYELIKQQALLLFTEKNHREALPLYQKLWENFSDKLDEWDGWRYAYCAQKIADYALCLDICRKVYLKYRDFKMIRNVYAWSIYYCEIKKEKITDEATFLRAAEGVLKLSTQDDQFSPYTLTVMKTLDYLNEKPNYPMDKILEWTQKLNPALMEKQPFSFIDKDGRQREFASPKEQYYMLRTRALLEKGDWDECIRLCEEALNTFDKLHYDNDVWFRWRIGLCYEGMGEYQKSLDMQLQLLKRKKEWFIQKEIAEQYYRLGEYEKSLQYALDSALNFGDNDKKTNTFIVLANTLEKLGKQAEATQVNLLIEKIKCKDASFEDNIKNLKPVWNSLKFGNRQQFSGVIKSILPNGKAGFVETGKGKSYYFSMRDFKANPQKATAGIKVSFYLEEGFDAKKEKKTMNAVELECIISKL